jgi:hypothetical protein
MHMMHNDCLDAICRQLYDSGLEYLCFFSNELFLASVVSTSSLYLPLKR